MPTAERLSALRLQAQAWQPFERHAARLILWDQLGLAIAWDEAALERDLAVHGLGLDRCLAIPELLVQRPMEAGVRLIRCLEGFEAQCWRAGQLHSSRWWPTAPSPEDWQTFLRAAGQRDELANAEALGSAAIPEPIEVEQAAAPWVKHHALQATGDNGQHQLERRLVFASSVLLALAAGAAAHQLQGAWQLEHDLKAQVSEFRSKAEKVLQVRDKAVGEAAAVQKLASFSATPQPLEVIAHLHETLARTGVQIKDMELEGERLKLGLQLGPTVGRASIVKDLQSGGWFADVNEARGDGGGRGLLTLEVRIKGAHPPVARTSDPAVPVSPPPNSSPQAAIQTKAATIQAASQSGAQPAPPTAVKQGAAKPAAEPFKPIYAKPDANGMPPANVFDAIPNR